MATKKKAAPKPRTGYRVESAANDSWDPQTRQHVLYLARAPELPPRVISFHSPRRHAGLALWVGEHIEGRSFNECYGVNTDRRSIRAFAAALLRALDAPRIPKAKRPLSTPVSK